MAAFNQAVFAWEQMSSHVNERHLGAFKVPSRSQLPLQDDYSHLMDKCPLPWLVHVPEFLPPYPNPLLSEVGASTRLP